MCVKRPKHLCHLLLLCHAIRRGLDCKGRNWFWNQHPYGMAALHFAAFPTMPLLHPCGVSSPFTMCVGRKDGFGMVCILKYVKFCFLAHRLNSTKFFFELSMFENVFFKKNSVESVCMWTDWKATHRTWVIMEVSFQKLGFMWPLFLETWLNFQIMCS